MNEHSQYISARNFSARKHEICSFKLFLTWLHIQTTDCCIICTMTQFVHRKQASLGERWPSGYAMGLWLEATRWPPGTGKGQRLWPGPGSMSSSSSVTWPLACFYVFCGDLRSQRCFENPQLTALTLRAAVRLTVLAPMLRCAPVCQTCIADECYIYCPPTTSQSRGTTSAICYSAADRGNYSPIKTLLNLLDTDFSLEVPKDPFIISWYIRLLKMPGTEIDIKMDSLLAHSPSCHQDFVK